MEIDKPVDVCEEIYRGTCTNMYESKTKYNS